MEYFVRHRTSYRYLQEVSYSYHLAHLRPRENAVQKLLSTLLNVTPVPANRVARTDYFGNCSEWFALDQPHTALEILSESRVLVSPPSPCDPGLSESWETVRVCIELADDEMAREAVQYIFDSPHTGFQGEIASYAAKSFPPEGKLLTGAIDLMHRIHRDFRYDTTVTDTATPIDRIFEIRAGVCQDLAHVGIAAMRSLGLPARYVSGYLLTAPPPGQKKLLGADASHAWFSVLAPPLGWVDLDPTNDMLTGEGHVTVAWGRDYGDIVPVCGVVMGGSDHIVEVGVDVIPAD
jgi:transglutaminase-like putative cysteine protease